MILGKIISTAIEKGMLIVKILGFGGKDIKTVYNLLPFGIDCNIPKGYRGVYADTGIDGEKVLIGIINNNVAANPGEIRIFATNNSGVEQIAVYLRNDGTCEIGGNADNLVRYAKLNTAMQSQTTLLNTELGKIQTAIQALGGTYAKQNVILNISEAKITNLKSS